MELLECLECQMALRSPSGAKVDPLSPTFRRRVFSERATRRRTSAPDVSSPDCGANDRISSCKPCIGKRCSSLNRQRKQIEIYADSN